MTTLGHRKIWLALAASTLALAGCTTVPVQNTTFDQAVLPDAPSSYELPLGSTQVRGSGSYYSTAPQSDWGRYDERYADDYYRNTYGSQTYYAQDAGLDRFAWLDLAYDVSDEIGTTEPDFSFRFNRRESFAWETWDGYRLYAEPIAGGYRYYYFGPGAERPFLVRDPLYSYAFRYGRLVAVYDRDGRILNYSAANRLLGEASYFYQLAREINSAARYGSSPRLSAAPLWLTWQNDIYRDHYRWGRDRYRHGDYDDWRRDRRNRRGDRAGDRAGGRHDRRDRDRTESRQERAERLARERDGRDPRRGRGEGMGGAGGRESAQLPERATPVLEISTPDDTRENAEVIRADPPVGTNPRGDGRRAGRGGRDAAAPDVAERPDRPRRPGQPVSGTLVGQEEVERDAMLQAEAERQARNDEVLRRELEAERIRRDAAERETRAVNARQQAEQARRLERQRQAEAEAARQNQLQAQRAEDERRLQAQARAAAQAAAQAESARQRQAEAESQRRAAAQAAAEQRERETNARLRAQQAREAEARRRAQADQQAQAQAQARLQAERRQQQQRAEAQRQAAAERQAQAQRQAAAQRQAEAQRQAAAARAQQQARPAPPPPPAPAATSAPPPERSSRPAPSPRLERPEREPD